MTDSKLHTESVTEQNIEFSSVYFYSSTLQSDHLLNSVANGKRKGLRSFKHFLIINHSHISKPEKITCGRQFRLAGIFSEMDTWCLSSDLHVKYTRTTKIWYRLLCSRVRSWSQAVPEEVYHSLTVVSFTFAAHLHFSRLRKTNHW